MDRAAGLLRVARAMRGESWLYDRRGYGRSTGAARSFDDHVDDLLSVITATAGAAGGPARPVVFGHSYGGVVALAAATRHPGAVAGLVVYEAPRAWEPWWPPSPPPGTDPGDYAEGFLRNVAGEDRWEEMGEAARALRRREGVPMVDELRWQSVQRYDGTAITGPVTVVVGERSRRTVRRAAELLADECPRGQLALVAGAEHMAPLTHPRDVAALVDAAADAARRA
jgi:pimeloyl-ACP methyl ester carboxylesterase